MVREGWNDLADWRDQRMGERGDLWHRAIIDPTLLRVVGRVRGMRVLDLACGNGYLTRRFARDGASVAVGIDLSPRSVDHARRRERARPSGARFLERNATHLEGLTNGSFDLVVANMALLDIPDAEGAIREVARVLAPEGRFVFSVSHPCFDLDERSGWIVERVREPDGHWHDVIWRKVRNYREERSVQVPWKISETETAFTVSYHRTLATYSRLLRDCGFAITRLEEPAPRPEAVRTSPQGPYLRTLPLHLVVEARPHPGLALRPRGPAATAPGSRASEGTAPKANRRSGSGGRSRGSGSRRRGSRIGS